MTQTNFTSQSLEAQRNLEEFIREIVKLEGTASPGETLDNLDAPAAAVLRSVLGSSVEISDPMSELMPLTPDMFEDIGFLPPLDWQVDDSKKDFRFYYMTITVALIPSGGAQFSRLLLLTELNPNAQYPAPIVHSIFPTTKWRSTYEVSAGAQVGLETALSLDVDAKTGALPASLHFPANVSVQVINTNKATGKFEIADFTYRFGAFDLTAAGTGQDFAQWEMMSADLRERTESKFIIVFKVPEEQKTLSLRLFANASVNFPWFNARIGDVGKRLGQKWRCFLNPSRPECQDLGRLFQLGPMAKREFGTSHPNALPPIALS